MDKVLSNKKAICIFVLPALLLFALVVILPIIYSGYYSTLQWDGIGDRTFIGIKNYITLFGSSGFLKAIKNSILLAGLSVFIQIPIALLLALVLAKGVKGEGFFRTIYFVPVILSTVVIGQLWMKIYHPSLGLMNTVLADIGLEHLVSNWLGDMRTSLGSVFVVIVWQYVGYHMLLLYASAKSIPADIYEAAKVDGASALRTAFQITIPLIKPMLKVCITFAIIGSLKSFDLIYILTNGGPVHSSEVPSTIMFNTIFHKYMYGYGSSMAIFIILECLVFALLVQKLVKVED